MLAARVISRICSKLKLNWLKAFRPLMTYQRCTTPGVAGDDLRDELVGHLAHLLEADAGAEQPVGQMVRVKRSSGPAEITVLLPAQNRHATVDQGEIEMPLPGLDAGPVDRQRHRGEILQQPGPGTGAW
jgi:hypothetical protein